MAAVRFRAAGFAGCLFIKDPKYKHLGTWRDTFCHEMDYNSSCALADPVDDSDLILFLYLRNQLYIESLAPENRQVEVYSQQSNCLVIGQGDICGYSGSNGDMPSVF